MEKLFCIADEYLKESDWKDLAMIKFCLAAIGVMIGLQVPRSKKKWAFVIAGIVFMVTYIPLMVKFFRIAARVWKGTEITE